MKDRRRESSKGSEGSKDDENRQNGWSEVKCVFIEISCVSCVRRLLPFCNVAYIPSILVSIVLFSFSSVSCFRLFRFWLSWLFTRFCRNFDDFDASSLLNHCPFLPLEQFFPSVSSDCSITPDVSLCLGFCLFLLLLFHSSVFSLHPSPTLDERKKRSFLVECLGRRCTK